MDDNTWIFLVILLVVVVLLLLYFVIFRMDDTKRRYKYSDLFDKSSGGYDEAAEDALETINGIEQPAAEDHFHAGTILGYNVIQGDIRAARNNPDTAQNILDRFQETVHNIEVGNIMGTLHPMFMLDHIDNFAENNIREVIDDNFWMPVIPGFYGLMAEVPVARQTVTENKKQMARRNANNHKEYVENYFDASVSHTSDKQNVHDSSVTKELRDTVDKIRQTSSNLPTTRIIEEIRQYVDQHAEQLGKEKHDNIIKALNKAGERAVITSYDETEDNILKYVWERSMLPENDDNCDNMREALLDALNDCITPEGGMVCAGGRASRILGSLVLQDADETIGLANTLEQYKNDIYQRCKDILDNEIDAAKASGVPEMKAVGDSYTDFDTQVDPAYEREFKDKVKAEYDTLINSYGDKISETQLENIKRDCYAALD